MVDGYSKYHINVVIDDLAQIKTRVTFVYGEAQVVERYKTWDMLRSIVGANDLPWAVIGDFNEVLYSHEHDGVANRSQAQMDAFRDALDTCGLSDIGFTGINWTFEKKVAEGTYARVRLDRCVANPAWSLAFPTAILEHKHTVSSDHIPIFRQLNMQHAVPRGHPQEESRVTRSDHSEHCIRQRDFFFARRG